MRISSEMGQQGAGTEGGPEFCPSPDGVPVLEVLAAKEAYKYISSVSWTAFLMGEERKHWWVSHGSVCPREVCESTDSAVE